jgi:hypothetical protein
MRGAFVSNTLHESLEVEPEPPNLRNEPRNFFVGPTGGSAFAALLAIVIPKLPGQRGRPFDRPRTGLGFAYPH